MSIPAYVYIMSNEGIPNAIKIGFTTREPEERAKELSSTGVLYPFKVEYATYFQDGTDVEKRLHRKYAKYRIESNREFFNVPKEQVITDLMTIKSSEPTGTFQSSYELYLAGRAFELGYHGYPLNYGMAKACYRKGLALKDDNVRALLLERLAHCLIKYPSSSVDELSNTLVELLQLEQTKAWVCLADFYFKLSENFSHKGELQECYNDLFNCLRNYIKKIDIANISLTEEEHCFLINTALKLSRFKLYVDADILDFYRTLVDIWEESGFMVNLSKMNKQLILELCV